jgi:uncharacterized protein (TIRG00374 family)
MSIFFKALRFKIFFGDANLALSKLFVITSFHNFFNQILPARTGEITLLYYMKKIAGINISNSLHSLIIVRIFDTILISIFFIISTIIFLNSKDTLLFIIIGLLILSSTFFIFFKMLSFLYCLRKIWLFITNIKGIKEKNITKKLNEKIDTVILVFESYNNQKNFLKLSICSFFIWLSLYTLYYASILSFSVNVTFIQSIVGSTGAVLAFILPINSVGNIGTLEAGWTCGYMFAGLNEQDAIITGFGFHIISLLASSLTAFLFFLLYKIANRTCFSHRHK